MFYADFFITCCTRTIHILSYTQTLFPHFSLTHASFPGRILGFELAKYATTIGSAHLQCLVELNFGDSISEP